MIRLYKDSDFEDVAFLNSTSYQNPCTESELRAKLANPAWVWEADPAVSSVIGCLITDLPRAETPEHSGRVFVWSITVAPPFRNKGIGAALLREVSKYFLALWLYVDSNSEARKLYEREGFKVDRFLPNHYGREEHAYLMVKR